MVTMFMHFYTDTSVAICGTAPQLYPLMNFVMNKPTENGLPWLFN